MAEAFDQDFADFSGGEVSGIKPTHILESECEVMENFYPYGPSAYRRNGVRALTTSEYADPLTGAFVFKDDAGTRHMIVGTENGFGKQSGNAIVALLSSLAFADDDEPPYFQQYLDHWYAVRASGSTLLRGDANAVYEAGIDAPAAAMSAAAAGGGTMTAGVYKLRYRFIGRNGQPGDLSAAVSVTVAANERINLTNIGTSTDPFVTDREIFITAPNEDGIFSSVGFVGDATSTTFTVDVVVGDDYGRQTGLSDNGVPTTGLLGLTQAWERFFAHDGEFVYYSNEGAVEGFDPDNTIVVYADETHKIKGLHFWGGRKLVVVMKTNAMHIISRSASGVFSLDPLDENQGGTAGHSLKSSGGWLFWYDGGSNGFFRSGGGEAEPADNHKIKTYLDLIPEDEREKVYATVYSALDWYVASIPQTGGNRIVLVYNYRTRSWARFTHAQSPHFIASLPNEDNTETLYALFGTGYLYEYHAAGVGKDFGSVFTAKVRPKAIVGKRPGLALTPRYARVHSNQVSHAAGSAVLRMFRNGVAGESRNISLDHADEIKNYTFGNIHQSSTMLQLQLEYTDEDQLILSGLGLSGVELERPQAYR